MISNNKFQKVAIVACSVCLLLSACGIKRGLTRPSEIPAQQEQQEEQQH